MSKKSKKHAKQKNRKDRNSGNGPPNSLQDFKFLWKAEEYPRALIAYRTWTKKSGQKRDPAVEGELLFRNASHYFSRGDSKKAMEYFDEAIEKGENERERCLIGKAVCLTKLGQLHASLELFRELDDPFHALIISRLIKGERPLPEVLPGDQAIEKTQLLRFWEDISAVKPDAENGEISTINAALKLIARGYSAFISGDNPEPHLKQLETKPGFAEIARYLMLVSAASLDRKTRCRNLIKQTSFPGLLEQYASHLFQRNDYTELAAVGKLAAERGNPSPVSDLMSDEMNFNLGLDLAKEHKLDPALKYFTRIKTRTVNVLHNIALVYQKSGQYEKANTFWLMLLDKEKKPKKSDPKPVILEYLTSCNYIARNFIQSGAPEKAEHYYKEVLSLEPNDRETLEELILVNNSMGNDDASLRYAKRLYECDPDNEDYLFLYTIELKNDRDFDTLISVCREGLAKDPENPHYQAALAEGYIQKGLTSRFTDLAATKKMTAAVKELGTVSCFSLYLEGHLLRKKGNTAAARKKFEAAADETELHMDEFDLGVCFFEDGLPDLSRLLFERILSCGCESSDFYFEKIVQFFADRDNFERAKEWCEYAFDLMGYNDGDIADLLLFVGKPEWAKHYSSRLISSDRAEDNDRFLHLEILNAIGAKEETLTYLEELRESARKQEDRELVTVFKEMAREVRAKGRYKIK